MSEVDKDEKLNAHQTKVGQQIESLVKAVFVLSGTALTISIGLFNSPNTITMSSAIKCGLKISWSSFFMSIIVLVISLSLIAVENYRLGSRWLRLTNENGFFGSKNSISFSLDKFIEVLLIVGVLLFIAGMSGLLYSSIGILDMPPKGIVDQHT